jgi:membrane protease subunit HflC
LVLIFVFMLFTFQVRQTEIAVVTTFGKYSGSDTNAGFQVRWPWPIQKVYKFDRRVHAFESKFDQSITSDQIPLLAMVYVGWRVAGDGRTFLEKLNGNVAEVERTLEPIVHNAKNEILGQHTFGDLISTNAANIQFDLIEREMLGRVQSRVREDYGIEIELLGIKQLGLPESITSTVFERMRAERGRLSAKYEAEGERDAKNIRTHADGQANAILAEALAQAARIQGDAEVQATRHYAAFKENPELAVFLFQLKALEQSLKEKTHLILDQQTPPFNLLVPGATAHK